ncbi:hypothetical protein FRB95_002811 [Tulasnella sp. JGI-2019a]|nr:hypothetical protein FRB95_002811 [Tulasnella sp. JGI-2019a]
MWSKALPVLALVASIFATPLPKADAPIMHEFRSNIVDGSLSYVNNSGVCETTAGVHTMSGYVNVGTTQSYWFWFFEARTAPSTAPLVLWFNGGPGCSSMIGLFQENGPCTVNSDGKTTTLNPNSWNNVANTLYIDQPIGTGFSHGTDPATGTESAAAALWTMLQTLFESPEFSTYQTRELIIATESYGGHYGPAFVSYFNSQNTLITAGSLSGVKITVTALMINNGWIDPAIQYLGYINYAVTGGGYGALVSSSAIKAANTSYYKSGGCLSQIEACYAASTSVAQTSASNTVCINADNYCYKNIESTCIGNQDVYDVRQQNPDPYPPEYYVTYLQSSTIQTKIGAAVTYAECPDAPYEKFANTGDDSRTWLPQLSTLANSKMKILIWAGDADYICNWMGGYAAVSAMSWYGSTAFANTAFTNVTVGGVAAAQVKNVDNFTFARVYGAGHEVPYYQPKVALAFLEQVIAGEPIHSV